MCGRASKATNTDINEGRQTCHPFSENKGTGRNMAHKRERTNKRQRERDTERATRVNTDIARDNSNETEQEG